jgi:ATP-dependent DNA helicase RecQ
VPQELSKPGTVEVRPNSCGNCDTCLNPPETWDASIPAQKALSCVHRTGQRFGVNYLIDVLMGKEDERIQRFGHDKLSTFGVGKELGANEWRGVFRQLIARGLLAVDLEGYGGLHLTDACRPVLRGEQRLMLRRDTKPEKVKVAPRTRGAFKRGADGQGVQVPREGKPEPADSALWEALRARRRQLAQEQGVPPYVVFHDATLMEMVARRPQTLDEFADISGVGEHKLAAYGEDFLGIIRAHAQDNNETEPVTGNATDT